MDMRCALKEWMPYRLSLQNRSLLTPVKSGKEIRLSGLGEDNSDKRSY